MNSKNNVEINEKSEKKKPLEKAISQEQEEYKNLHKNHRDRLRKKFMQSDGDILEDHELIELLLFYVYNQKNTNPIARMLIKKFGTIYNIFSASEEELLSVPGIGPQAVALLKLQATLMRKYYSDGFSAQKKTRLTPETAGDFIMSHFYGYSNEVLIMIALDSDYRVLRVKTVAKGSIDAVQTFIRDLVEEAIHSKASKVILAHNHPNGVLEASPSDLELTIDLEKALSFVGVKLVDHIIVSRDKYLSIASEYGIFEF